MDLWAETKRRGMALGAMFTWILRKGRIGTVYGLCLYYEHEFGVAGQIWMSLRKEKAVGQNTESMVI